MSFDLPVPVLLAIMRLNQRGYDAYAVGGCVRDMLRGVTPHDYDICTSCEPQEMHSCEEPGLQTCLESMHQSRAFQEDVLLLARHARHSFAVEETAVMLSRFGEERLLKLLKLQQACGVLSEQESVQRKTRIRAAQAANLPMSLRELPINGTDLEKMGLNGEQIGEALQKLHLMVLRGQLPCDRASLIAWLIRQKD